MSRVILISARERWRARRAVVTRWLAPDVFEDGAAICEIEVDGATRVMTASGITPPDVGCAYWRYVAEGREIGSDGYLFEYGVLPQGWAETRPGKNALHSSARQPLVRRPSYPRIFLSYRRDDADAYAGRLHEVLTRELGEEVFMDLFGIRGGEPFPWAIQQAVAHAQVMVVLIGTKWLTMTSPGTTRRRIEDSYDFVHREVVAALDRGIAVVPVLLPGAAYLERAALPEPMHGLEVLQALPVAARTWAADVDPILVSVRTHLAAAAAGGI